MSLDGNDIRILQVLQSRAAVLPAIAEKVKVSVPTVSSKVSNLRGWAPLEGTGPIWTPKGWER